jgi:hypothetical protein
MLALRNMRIFAAKMLSPGLSSGGSAFPQFHTLNDAHGQIVTNGALYFAAQPDIATALSANRLILKARSPQPTTTNSLNC